MSDIQESEHIKMRLQRNSSVYNVSRPKDVLISSAIVDYGSTSDEEISTNISKQEGRTEVHSMEEFRLRNNEELQGNFIYESKQYAEMAVTNDDGNEKDRVDAISVGPTRQIIDRDEIVSEKHKSVFEGIKNNNDKCDIHTELVKSGNESIFNDEGKSEVVIEQVENSKESINQCYGKCSVAGDIVKGENNDIGNSTIITE